MYPDSKDIHRRVNELVQRHGTVLTREIGLDGCMVEVFFCLFERRIYSDESEYSAYQVYQEVFGLRSAQLTLMKSKVTHKEVDHALANLYSFGMIEKMKPSGRRRNRSDGRPPKYVYKAKNPSEIMKLIEEKLNSKKEKLFGVFGALEDLEAARNARSRGTAT